MSTFGIVLPAVHSLAACLVFTGMEERGRCLFVSLAELLPVLPSREYACPAVSLPFHSQAKRPQKLKSDTPAPSACPAHRSVSGEKVDTSGKQIRGNPERRDASSADRDDQDSLSDRCEGGGATEEWRQTEKSKEGEKSERMGLTLIHPDPNGLSSSGPSPSSSCYSAPCSWFPYFPPLRYAVVAQSRLYNKRHGLIIRGRNLNCRAAPLPHPPAKVGAVLSGY